MKYNAEDVAKYWRDSAKTPVGIVYWFEYDSAQSIKIGQKAVEFKSQSFVHDIEEIQNLESFDRWPDNVIPDYVIIAEKLEKLGF